MQVGYGILIDGEAFNFMRRIELSLKQNHGLKNGIRQSPHITVKPPFEVQQIEPHLEYLERLCNETEQFQIEINGFNRFGKKVIYLDIMPNNALNELHNKILKHLELEFEYEPDPLEGDNIVFHATLAYNDIDEADFDAIYKGLENKHTPHFKFNAKQLALFYKLDDDAGWIIAKKHNLKINS